MQYFCERCWIVFHNGSLAMCPNEACASPAPTSGWQWMPHLFRGRYRFERQIGRGAMGAVFSARVMHDRAPDEPEMVAVKVIQQRTGATPDVQAALRERFENERRASVFLDASARFVRVIAAEGSHLVLEHVTWPTLTDFSREVTLKPIEVARLGAEILEGVEEMHEVGIVHRDLKPDNLFIDVTTGEYRVKVFDLGVCLLRRRGAATRSRGSASAMAGTPDYMSPEQVDDPERVGPAADLYAVASLLWQLAEGAVPFPLSGDERPLGDRLRERRQRQEKPPVARQLPREPELLELLLQALNLDPTKRPMSAKAMGDAMREFAARWEVRERESHERTRTRIEAMHASIGALQLAMQPVLSLHGDVGRIAGQLDAYRDNLGASGSATIVTTHGDLNHLDVRLEECSRALTEFRGTTKTATAGARRTTPTAPAPTPPTETSPPPPAAKATGLDALVMVAVFAVGLGVYLGVIVARIAR